MWCISLQATYSVAYSLLEALESFSESVSLFEDPIDHATWHVRALTENRPLLEELEKLVQTICQQHKSNLPIINIEEVPEKDWVAENQLTFSPRTVGRFYVHDTYHQDHLPQDKICLQIDASTAFGTGHHGTTQGCLEALQLLHQKGYKFENVIDIGTGTGILAIGCTKLFDVTVLATDIDSEAILKAEENICLNNCSSRVILSIADGLTDPVITLHQPFDLVIANILANTLLDLAPHIVQVTSKGSILILSGLLQEQTDSVVIVYHTYGYILKKMIVHEEWITLILYLNII